MAYREFYKPADFPVSDFSPIARGFQNLFTGLAEARNKRTDLSNQYKYTLDYGQFENDNKFNEAYVKNVAQMGRENYKRSTSPSQQLVEAEEQGRRFRADQKAQETLFKNLNDPINKKATEDAYYKPDIELRALQLAAYGEDADVDFRTRGERLQTISGSIGSNPVAFKRKNYAHDWVNLYGKKENEKKSGNSRVDKSNYASSPFWDDKTGSPGVTDQHVLDYLNSREDVTNSLAYEVKNEIAREADQIQKLAKQGDERFKKFKDMDDDMIALHLIANEEDNLINKTPYNERVREKGRKDLQEAAGITMKTDVNYKEAKSRNNVSTEQRHEYTMFDNSIGDAERLSGPGGTLMQKNGKPLQIQVDAENGLDLRTGKTSKRAGESAFNVTGYQLVPFRRDGTPLLISGKSTDDLVGQINQMDDISISTMEPEMKVVLRGFSIDRNNAINDVNRKKGDLEQQMGEAIEAGDTEAQQKLEVQIDMVERLRDNLGRDDTGDEELMGSMRRSNITTNSVRYDELIVPSQADLKRIKGVTTASDGSGGLNLSNKDHWSDDMKKVNDAYKSKLSNIREKGPDVVKVETVASDGKDIDSWSTRKQYKVGENLYFYNGETKQWERK